MVVPCLSDHTSMAIIWYKYNMRVVILVVMMPYNDYDYDDAYPIPSYACHMVHASYDHGCPYVYDAMVIICVSYPMAMDVL